MREALAEIIQDYCLMERLDKLAFLEWLRKDNPHMWDYSGMGEGLRRFYSNEPRSENDK